MVTHEAHEWQGVAKNRLCTRSLCTFILFQCRSVTSDKQTVSPSVGAVTHVQIIRADRINVCACMDARARKKRAAVGLGHWQRTSYVCYIGRQNSLSTEILLIHLRRVTISSCFAVKCFHKNIFLISLHENSLVPNITIWNKFCLNSHKQKANRKGSVPKLIPTVQTQCSFNV